MSEEELTCKTRMWRERHSDWISDHFCMDEFTYSAVAVEHGLDNTPTREAVRAIKNLVEKLLEPLRVYHRLDMQISSGFRSEELNRLVGGKPNSQHLSGEAVDIYTLGSARLLDDLEDSCLNFDQAIFYRRRGFMHLSLKQKGKNRRQIIII
ncbi:MAG: D-Ala-D-Ala carboxypeptidase family metallohydrolase [Tannerellaceae bacterium]